MNKDSGHKCSYAFVNKRMRTILLAIFVSLAAVTAVGAQQSKLLENVKKNPEEAIALCNKFRSLNSQGISASSEETINEVSTQKNLSTIDAEILSIYVIGLHCPDVD